MMNLISALVTTSLSLSTSTGTSLSTIYRTSQVIMLTTLTSIVSEFSTLVSTSTMSGSEIIMASTVEIPVTITNTISQILTNTPADSSTTPTWPIPSPPPPTVEIVTSTLISTLTQPGKTLTYYPSVVPVVATTTTASDSWVSPTSTITFTQVDFIFEDTTGSAYTTMTTILPVNPRQTQEIIPINSAEDHG